MHLLHSVGSFHSPESAIVEDGHEETLCQIVQVLPEGQHIVLLSAGRGIYPASLHAGAKTANRI